VSALAHPAAGGDEPAWPDDAVEVGRVLGAWGVKGGIRVKPFSADPQALFSSRRWFIAPADVSAARPAGAKPMVVPRLLRITHAREHVDTSWRPARN
jgi:16S rRNA processing protein RimM